ncbi:MAG: hypothetical protein AAB790_00410 [Patescibacteria group bacterium]|mgnify:CR=1 FL=1
MNDCKRIDVLTQAQCALLTASTPLLQGMSEDDLERRIIRHPELQNNLADVFRRQSGFPGLPGTGIKILRALQLEEVPGKKTADCFTKKWSEDRNLTALEQYLPEEQRAQSASSVLVFELGPNNKSSTILSVASCALRLAWDVLEFGFPLESVSKLLIRRGHTMTLPTLEHLVERQMRGEDVGFKRTGSWAPEIWSFVESKNGDVVICRLYSEPNSLGKKWQINIPFGSDFEYWRKYDLCYPGLKFVIPNWTRN